MNIEGHVPIPGATGLSPADLTNPFDLMTQTPSKILPAKRLTSPPITPLHGLRYIMRAAQLHITLLHRPPFRRQLYASY